MTTNKHYITQIIKRAITTALCTTVLTVATITPGFAATTDAGNGIQGQIPEFQPTITICPYCADSNGESKEQILPDSIMETKDKILPDSIMETKDKILPDSIMEPTDKILPDSIMEPTDKIIPDTIMEPKDNLVPETTTEPTDKVILDSRT
jgi:cytochrome c553